VIGGKGKNEFKTLERGGGRGLHNRFLPRTGVRFERETERGKVGAHQRLQKKGKPSFLLSRKEKIRQVDKKEDVKVGGGGGGKSTLRRES